MSKTGKAAKIKINTILTKDGEFQKNVTTQSIANMCKDDCNVKKQFIEALRPVLQKHIAASTKKSKSSKKTVVDRACLLSNNPALVSVFVDWLKRGCNELADSIQRKSWRTVGGRRVLECLSLCADLLGWLYDDGVVEGLVRDCVTDSGRTDNVLVEVKRQLDGIGQVLREHSDLSRQLLDSLGELGAVSRAAAVPAGLTLTKLVKGAHFSAISGKGRQSGEQVQVSLASADLGAEAAGGCGSEGADVSELLRKRKLEALTPDEDRTSDGSVATVRTDCIVVDRLFPLLLAQLPVPPVRAPVPVPTSSSTSVHVPVVQIPGRASILPAWMTQAPAEPAPPPAPSLEEAPAPEAEDLLEELPEYLSELSEDHLLRIMEQVEQQPALYLARDGRALRALVDALTQGGCIRGPPGPTQEPCSSSNSNADQASAFLASLGQELSSQSPMEPQAQGFLEVPVEHLIPEVRNAHPQHGSVFTPRVSCRYFERGNCSRGAQCTYIHELPRREGSFRYHDSKDSEGHQSRGREDQRRDDRGSRGHQSRGREDQRRDDRDSRGYQSRGREDQRPSASNSNSSSSGIKVLNVQEIVM